MKHGEQLLKRCIFIIFIFSYLIHPQDILYITSKHSHPDLQFKINLVSRFYGLTVDSINTQSEKNREKLNNTIAKIKPKILIITEDALTYGIPDIILKVNCPVLIADIKPQNNSSNLKIMSKGIITGSKIKGGELEKRLYVSDQKVIVNQLAGQAIPI